MKAFFLLLSLCMISACSAAEDPGSAESETKTEKETEEQTTSLQKETLANELHIPWSVQKHGDTTYISERGGTIVRLKDQRQQRQPVSLDKNILHQGEGGLLGFVLHPNFENNQRAFVYHTYRENNQIGNRVVSIHKTTEGWKEQQTLLEGIPGSSIHNGGRMAIGPDNKLYVTTGDAGTPERAQDKENLAGKILRLEFNGDIPKDNPFPESYLYSYGHRNPQGLAWSEDGEIMFSSEHGSSAHDEINIIEPGKNYGWPVIQGDEQKDGMTQPLFHSGTNTWAPSGIAYRDPYLYVTGLRGSQLLRFHVDQQTHESVVSGEGRLRDIMIRQQHFYIITNNTDGRGDPKKQDDRLIILQPSS